MCHAVNRVVRRSIYPVAAEPNGERLVDDTRRDRVSIASVELPGGVKFEQRHR
jgi:hypothetical protein